MFVLISVAKYHCFFPDNYEAMLNSLYQVLIEKLSDNNQYLIFLFEIFISFTLSTMHIAQINYYFYN